MSKHNLRASAKAALFWVGAATAIRDAAQFVATIALARLLTPSEYGQAALAQSILIFVAVFSFRSFAGFGLQARDPKKFDWAAHLQLGLLVNAVCFCVVLIGCVAAFIAWPRSGNIPLALLVMALSFLIEPLALLHMTALQAHHQWRRLRTLELAAALAAIVGGLALAGTGYGVFALAAMTPLQNIPGFVDALRNGRRINMPNGEQLRRAGPAMRFGLNRGGSGMIGAAVGLLETSLLSNRFGLGALGIYNRALGLSNMTSGRIGPLVVQTMYPVLTRAEPSSARFHRFADILMTGIIMMMLPACAFLAFEARELVVLLFGAQWLPAADLVPIAAAFVFIGSMNFTVYQVMLANLQHRACFLIDLFAASVRVAVILIIMPYGVSAFLAALALTGAGLFVISFITAKKAGSFAAWSSVSASIPISIASAASLLLLTVLPELSINSVGDLGHILIDVVVFTVATACSVRLIAKRSLAKLVEGAPLGQAARDKIAMLLRLKLVRS